MGAEPPPLTIGAENAKPGLLPQMLNSLPVQVIRGGGRGGASRHGVTGIDRDVGHHADPGPGPDELEYYSGGTHVKSPALLCTMWERMAGMGPVSEFLRTSSDLRVTQGHHAHCHM